MSGVVLLFGDAQPGFSHPDQEDWATAGKERGPCLLNLLATASPLGARGGWTVERSRRHARLKV